MKSGSKRTSIKTSYLLYLIKSMSSLLFPVLTFAYTSRVLSVENIGKVDFSRSIVSYFTLFSTLGIVTYGTREGAKVRDDRQKLSMLVKELFFINAVTTIVTYTAFCLVLAFSAKLADYRGLLLISGLNIGFTSLGMEWLYNALEEYRYITVRTILFQAAAFVLLLLCVKNREDVSAYAAILVFSSVGSNILNFVNAGKYVSIRTHDKLNIKRHIRPVLIFFSNTIAGNVYLTLDTSMVGLLSDNYSVGLYSAGNKMNRICLSAISALSAVLLPRITYYLKKGDEKKYRELIKKCAECVMMLSCPIACGMAVLSKDVLLVFSGNEFAAASVCSGIMSLILIFIPVSTFLCNQILIPYGKEKYQLMSTILGAAANVTVNLLLIPVLDEIGAAVGTVISEFIVCSVLCIGAFKVMDYRFAVRNIWHYILAASVMSGSLYLIPQTVPVIHVLTSFGIGAFIYFAVLILLKDEFVWYIIHSLLALVQK